MVNILGSRYVELHEIGNLSKPRADLLVTTLHGETSRSGILFKELPRLRGALDPRDQECFDTYLDLDTDTFSEPVAWEFIQQLQDRLPSLRVRWAQVNIHRAVVDCNRANPQDAIRKLWLPNGEHQELIDALAATHAQAMAELEAAMFEVPYVFDIHTMYPYSPLIKGHQALQETRGSLAGYVQAYMDGLTGGKRRPLDVILSNGSGVIHGDPSLAGAILDETQKKGFLSNLDTPYHFGLKPLVTKRLLEGRVGIAVDIPKDLLRDKNNKNPLFNEDEVDDDRVEQLASTFVEPWLRRLRA